jgi:hypothetical protein
MSGDAESTNSMKHDSTTVTNLRDRPPNSTVLSGMLVGGDATGGWKLYLGPDATEYVDLRDEDIVYVRPAISDPTNPAPSKALMNPFNYIVHVRPDVSLEYKQADLHPGSAKPPVSIEAMPELLETDTTFKRVETISEVERDETILVQGIATQVRHKSVTRSKIVTVGISQGYIEMTADWYFDGTKIIQIPTVIPGGGYSRCETQCNCHGGITETWENLWSYPHRYQYVVRYHFYVYCPTIAGRDAHPAANVKLYGNGTYEFLFS